MDVDDDGSCNDHVTGSIPPYGVLHSRPGASRHAWGLVVRRPVEGQ